MALFQTSVLKKYLKAQDQEQINKAYKKFSNYFLNHSIQENIKSSKEEEYQGIFLTELFVKVLGYTMKPNVDFNLVAEYKNQTNSRKADGAILKDDIALGVIELKGTNTKDLESIRKQAFDYKANQKGCKYVITSNFEKLRFYINDATEYLEFNLFGLTEEQFTLLYLCLSKGNLLQNIPLEIKEASLVEENQITKGFYKDYSVFKRELYRDLVRNNAKKLKAIRKNELLKQIEETATLDAEIARLEKNVKLTLFKKSQKLIDRFLFIFFAEDRGLLPPNAILQIIEDWHNLKDLDVNQPLYERFKLYFSYLDTGRKGTDKKAEIFAYNGGLFKPDAVLDLLEISDELLYQHTAKLSSYDFESQVDVNILGHIFENSLNEIESVNAEIEGDNFDKQKSKRKKDGVFYTPKYITKYIVENTVGKLCQEKKTELDFHEENYFEVKKGTKTATKKKLLATLDTYRDWLLQLTICDPACGSGAFLNQALEFLIAEHAYIDELKAKVLGGAIVFSDIENTILEKNIYGVDINEESVEIAKLSLWLRTAQPRRKLNDLSSNIKCGNSLIEDKSVAGDKAFKWEKEFPTVFAKGGFDVVIGNPPYVDIKGMNSKTVNYFFQEYHTVSNRINLYSIFIEKGYRLLKNMGFLSYINPNSILVNSSYEKIRRLLIDDMTTIIKLPDDVFEDAKVETIIFEFRKNYKNQDLAKLVYAKDEKTNSIDISKLEVISKEDWKVDNFNFNIYVNPNQLNLLNKLKQNCIFLEEFADFTLGITPYDKYKGHTANLIKNRGYHSLTKIDDSYKPLISGANIERYYVDPTPTEFIKYGDWLGAPREERFFKNPRIIVRQIVSGNPPRIYAGYTEENLYFTQIGFAIIPNPGVSVKVLAAIINSKLINFYHTYQFLDLEKSLFQKILIANCKRLPIPYNISEPKQFEIEDKVLKLSHIKANSKNKITKFQNYLLSQFPVEKLSKKLLNWPELDFSDFIKELNKAINKENRARRKNEEAELPKLTKKDEFEWMELFEDNKKKAVELKTEINRLDNQIDQMVYELYGLTEEEIKIVENTD